MLLPPVLYFSPATRTLCFCHQCSTFFLKPELYASATRALLFSCHSCHQNSMLLPPELYASSPVFYSSTIIALLFSCHQNSTPLPPVLYSFPVTRILPSGYPPTAVCYGNKVVDRLSTKQRSWIRLSVIQCQSQVHHKQPLQILYNFLWKNQLGHDTEEDNISFYHTPNPSTACCYFQSVDWSLSALGPSLQNKVLLNL